MRSDCPISCSLDMLGDKWTLVILRDALFKEYQTYGEFQKSPESIATNILASRLKRMVDEGIFEKQKDPTNKLIVRYVLTEKGRALKPVLYELAKWGMDHVDGVADVRNRMGI